MDVRTGHNLLPSCPRLNDPSPPLNCRQPLLLNPNRGSLTCNLGEFVFREPHIIGVHCTLNVSCLQLHTILYAYMYHSKCRFCVHLKYFLYLGPWSFHINTKLNHDVGTIGFIQLLLCASCRFAVKLCSDSLEDRSASGLADTLSCRPI